VDDSPSILGGKLPPSALPGSLDYLSAIIGHLEDCVRLMETDVHFYTQQVEVGIRALKTLATMLQVPDP
jgi:hypothetical protein